MAGGQLIFDFAENMIHAAAGNEPATVRTRAQVITSARAASDDDYEIPARIYLNDALCTVVKGGVDEGVRQATDALDSMSADLRNNHITETGRTVLRAVPLDQRDRPAVRDLKAITSGIA